jgi:hypothetical protein
MNEQQPDTDWSPPGKWLKRSQLYVIMGACVALALLLGLLGKSTPEISTSDDTQPEPNVTSDAISGAVPDETVDAALPSEEMPLESSPQSDPAATMAFDSREPEATQAGYAMVYAWSQQIALTGGQEVYIDVAATPDYRYLVLARTTQDCDVDAIINDAVKDDLAGPDATIEFVVPYETTVHVRLPVNSQSGSCTIGYGVYRR